MTIDLGSAAITRPGATGPNTSRTFDDRLADWMNVRDFGAVGNGVTDDHDALLAALVAADQPFGGGIVYVPTGIYHVGSGLIVPTSNNSITLLGDGASVVDGMGSIISGNVPGYLLYAGFLGPTIKRVQGIGFKNSNPNVPIDSDPPNSPDIKATVTSTQPGTGGVVRVNLNVTEDLGAHWLDPGYSIVLAGIVNASNGLPNEANGTWTIVNSLFPASFPFTPCWIEIATPFITAAAAAGTAHFNGTGNGCLYISVPGTVVQGCDFVWGDPIAGTGGIAITMTNFGVNLINCSFTGPWKAGIDPLASSYGIVTRATLVTGCTFNKCGVAGNVFHGGIEADFSTVTNCGIGLYSGFNLVSYFEQESGVLSPRQNNGALDIKTSLLQDMGSKYFYLALSSLGLQNSTLVSNGSVGNPDSGIFAGGTIGLGFRNSSIAGTFTAAGVNLNGSGASSHTGVSSFLDTVKATVSGGGGVPWVLAPSFNYWAADSGAQNDPFLFRNCPAQDGGLPFFALPPAASADALYPIVCTDSVDPIWNGSVSNAGKVLVGGGNNRVMARFKIYGTVSTNAISGSWTFHSTTITMSTSNPGFVQPGMFIRDQNNNFLIALVVSYVGTTLTIDASIYGNAGAFRPGNAGDVLQFAAYNLVG